ncbi:MAG: sulfotransferase [Parvularculaceae bacterium]|nr:sulfotransferase [Parvularculaceae bacterium]
MTDVLPGSARPIVLCGSLRAGTTLLRLLLGQHSQISGHGESDFLFDEAPLARDGSFLGADALATYRIESVKHRPAVRNGFRAPEGETFDAMVADYLSQHPATAPHLLVTLHRNYHHAARVMKDAFFIRLQRDPRDVALSSVAMGWGGVPYYGVEPWIGSERDWQDAAPLIPESQQIFVRYEDLTSDPKGELTRILEAAGLSFEDAVMDPKGSTYSPPEPRPAEAFRKKLTEQEIAEINSRLTWVKQDYGYNLQPATQPAGLRKAMLSLKGRQKVVAHKIGRFGLSLYVRDLVARRFGLAGMREQTRAQMEAIKVNYQK